MTRRRILLVDDVPEIVEYMRLALELSLDAEIVTENDSTAAAARLERERFDLVVSDYHMPGLDGVAVLAAARRANPSGRRALFTGYNEVPASQERLQSAGLDALLQKPLAPEEFVSLVKRLVEA